MILKAPGKVNIILDLLKKRPDGYHETNFLMSKLKLFDVLEVDYFDFGHKKELNGFKVKKEENLIYRVVEELEREIGKEISFSITLKDKKAGYATGLGLGSSQAAEVLKKVNEILDLNLSEEKLINIISKVTTDGCFFVSSTSSAIVQGKGDKIFPVTLPKFRINLVFLKLDKMPEKKTKWVYSNVDLKRRRIDFDLFSLVKKINNEEDLAKYAYNIFEEMPLDEYYAPVFEFLSALREEEFVKNASLSGAGPTIFYFGKHRSKEYFENNYDIEGLEVLDVVRAESL